MKKRFFLMIVLLSIPSLSFGQSWRKISKQIIKKQEMALNPYNEDGRPKRIKRKNKKRSWKYYFLSTYHTYRIHLNLLKRMDINTKNDTLYILELLPDVAYSTTESTIFTRRKILSYSYEGHWDKHADITVDSLEITDKPLYPRYMLKLVIQWNLPKLEKESEEYESIPNYYLWLTRVIFHNKKYKIDSFFFKEFWDLERDFNDDFYYKTESMQKILDELFSY